VATFVLTYNPARWNWDEEGRADAVARTEAGRVVHRRWSTGSRRSGISHGDLAVLFQQGDKERGLVAYGRFASEIYQDEHWDGTGRDANYADLEWEVVLPAGDMIPVDEVKRVVTTVNWDVILGSGIVVPPPDDAALEALWSPIRRGARGGRWQPDPERRRRVEDYAQTKLEQHYRDQGWYVKDVRIGNPYDALATKPGSTVDLAARSEVS
jgi:hypothetical protein